MVANSTRSKAVRKCDSRHGGRRRRQTLASIILDAQTAFDVADHTLREIIAGPTISQRHQILLNVREAAERAIQLGLNTISVEVHELDIIEPAYRRATWLARSGLD